MVKRSAGLVMYRWIDGELEVLLVHPGGPFFAKKDVGAWTIPKGEVSNDEDTFSAARREFVEETGLQPTEPFIELTEIKQASGKRVKAWAFEGNCDPTTIVSNTFEMEWPPRSGKHQSFPEADRGAWFRLDDARIHVLASQVPLLNELEVHLKPPNSQAQ
jgi:predicted NUDIX family NTP pyrophosphohydrolase